jgi:hypothetical protein
MRRFRDPEGRPWDAVVGRESWGSLYVVFVPAGIGRTDPVRQALLQSAGYDQAHHELAEMGEEALMELFRASEARYTT